MSKMGDLTLPLEVATNVSTDAITVNRHENARGIKEGLTSKAFGVPYALLL